MEESKSAEKKTADAEKQGEGEKVVIPQNEAEEIAETVGNPKIKTETDEVTVVEKVKELTKEIHDIKKSLNSGGTAKRTTVSEVKKASKPSELNPLAIARGEQKADWRQINKSVRDAKDAQTARILEGGV